MARIYGWDLSHYDWGRGSVDLAGAKAAGISFMTHKATEGTTYGDPKFSAFIQRARLAKVPLIGAYMVLVPAKDPVAQAKAFLARLDAVWSGWRDGPFILQIDSEKFSYMTRAPSLSEIKSCCNYLWQVTKGRYRPIVYAPQWGYKDTLTGLGYPLWQSAYGSNPAVDFKSGYPGDSSSRWSPYSGQVPAILQYGSNLTIGSQKQCDANVYRGTVADLTNLVSPGMGVDAVSSEDDMTPEQDQLLRDIFANIRAGNEGAFPNGQPYTEAFEDGSTGVSHVALARTLDKLVQAAAADEARDKALAAAFDAIKSAGVDLDTAAVVAAVQKVGSDVSAQVQALRQENADLRTRLAKALGDSATQG